jgi:hypothetical protein
MRSILRNKCSGDGFIVYEQDVVYYKTWHETPYFTHVRTAALDKSNLRLGNYLCIIYTHTFDVNDNIYT